jgi:hypothetical protein
MTHAQNLSTHRLPYFVVFHPAQDVTSPFALLLFLLGRVRGPQCTQWQSYFLFLDLARIPLLSEG